MKELPEYPIIQNYQLYGNPYGEEDIVIRCPICGEEAELFYRYLDNEIVGCENCIREIDSWKL